MHWSTEKIPAPRLKPKHDFLDVHLLAQSLSWGIPTNHGVFKWDINEHKRGFRNVLNVNKRLYSTDHSPI